MIHDVWRSFASQKLHVENDASVSDFSACGTVEVGGLRSEDVNSSRLMCPGPKICFNRIRLAQKKGQRESPIPAERPISSLTVERSFSSMKKKVRN